MMFNKVTVCLFLAFNLLPLADAVFAETLPACSGMQITESCHANATTLGNETLNTYTVADGAEMQFSGLNGLRRIRRRCPPGQQYVTGDHS